MSSPPMAWAHWPEDKAGAPGSVPGPVFHARILKRSLFLHSGHFSAHRSPNSRPRAPSPRIEPLPRRQRLFLVPLPLMVCSNFRIKGPVPVYLVTLRQQVWGMLQPLESCGLWTQQESGPPTRPPDPPTRGPPVGDSAVPQPSLAPFPGLQAGAAARAA